MLAVDFVVGVSGEHNGAMSCTLGEKKGGDAPSSEIARFTNGHAAQVSAHTEHDEPLGLLDMGVVGLWIAKALASSDEVWMEVGVCTVGGWKERA